MNNKQEIDFNCWNVLIVDDKIDLHKITKNAFFDEEIKNKELNFLSAYNEKEAINILIKHHKNISVMILDMVMDHNGDEGIRVLKHLHDKLNNRRTQIILRTGYARKEEVKNVMTDFPEVIILEKGETDVEKLIRLVAEAINKYNNE